MVCRFAGFSAGPDFLRSESGPNVRTGQGKEGKEGTVRILWHGMAFAACVPRGFPGGSGTRASAPTPSRCSAASWTAGRRMGGRLPRREENQRKGAAFPLIFVGVRFCYGAAVPMKLSYSWESSISAPPIPRAACGDKGQGAVNPGAPRPGGRCSRPTGGCSRRSRRRCPGPPRRRRGRGPGGSAGSRGQTPPCGCRRR